MRGFCLRLVFALFVLLAPASIGERVASASAQPTDSKPAATAAREPASASSTPAESAKPDPWSRLETISRILSIAAIPILVALVGWLVQRQLQKQSVSKDYVQLAVTILREPDSSNVSVELRSWAVDLLNAYSVVKLGEAVSTVLKAGQAVLPPLEGFAANPSPALTPELQDKMQSALATFQQYLKEAGFQIRSEGTIRYEVVPGDTIKTNGEEYYAFYDPGSLTMKVASAYANEVDVIRHEYMRHVLTDSDHGLMNLRNWLEDGSPWWNSFAIASGLAVYFPCSFMGSPVFAADHEELKVKLKNNARFRGQVSDIVRADNLGNKVWGGAFWEIREGFSEPGSADRFLAASWVAWKPTDPKADLFIGFANQLIGTDQLQSGGQHIDHIQTILRRRGLEI